MTILQTTYPQHEKTHRRTPEHADRVNPKADLAFSTMIKQDSGGMLPRLKMGFIPTWEDGEKKGGREEERTQEGIN